MDKRTRELERRALDDPNARGILLAEYVRNGMVSKSIAEICALLGHPEARRYTGEHTAYDMDACLEQALPKKVFVSLGLGALLELELRLGETIDQTSAFPPEMNNLDIREGIEDLQKIITSCRIFQQHSVPAFLAKKSKESIIHVPGYRVPLTPMEHAYSIRDRCEDYERRSRFSYGVPGRIEIPRYLGYYFGAHLALGRAINKKPGQRAKECIDASINSCVHGDDPGSWLTVPEALAKEEIFVPIIWAAAKRQVYLGLLGPYLA
jgi:hypothetical protein